MGLLNWLFRRPVLLLANNPEPIRRGELLQHMGVMYRVTKVRPTPKGFDVYGKEAWL